VVRSEVFEHIEDVLERQVLYTTLAIVAQTQSQMLKISQN